MKKYICFAALFAACAFWSGKAAALDVADVKTLVANDVDEAVIISMVQSAGALQASAGDIVDLRNLGASDTLLAAVGTAPSATGAREYILEDGTTVVVPQTTPAAPSGTVYYAPPAVVTAPPTVYYAPPTVYYSPYPRSPVFRRPRAGVHFSFGFGSGRPHRPPFHRW